MPKKIRRYKNMVMIGVACVFLCAHYGISQAQDADNELRNADLPKREGIKVGPMVAHGAMRAAEQLDTNIFLANSDRKFDAITVLSPSVGIELPLRENKISASGICFFSPMDNLTIR